MTDETVFLACRGEGRIPRLLSFTVTTNQDLRPHKDHQDQATGQARGLGFKGPFVPFDADHYEELVQAGDQARQLLGRSLYLAQGRVWGDDDDTAIVVEAASLDDAREQLREELVGRTSYEDLEEYDEAERNETLDDNSEIFVINIYKVGV